MLQNALMEADCLRQGQGHALALELEFDSAYVKEEGEALKVKPCTDKVVSIRFYTPASENPNTSCFF
jgi:hypothetical protein